MTKAKRSKNSGDTMVPRLTSRLEDAVRARLAGAPAPGRALSKRKLKAKKATQKTVELKRKFRAAHAKGMKALKRHDYDTFGQAVAEESQILNEQAALIAARRKEAATLSREIVVLLKTGRKAKKSRANKSKALD